MDQNKLPGGDLSPSPSPQPFPSISPPSVPRPRPPLWLMRLREGETCSFGCVCVVETERGQQIRASFGRPSSSSRAQTRGRVVFLSLFDTRRSLNSIRLISAFFASFFFFFFLPPPATSRGSPSDPAHGEQAHACSVTRLTRQNGTQFRVSPASCREKNNQKREAFFFGLS